MEGIKTARGCHEATTFMPCDSLDTIFSLPDLTVLISHLFFFRICLYFSATLQCQRKRNKRRDEIVHGTARPFAYGYELGLDTITLHLGFCQNQQHSSARDDSFYQFSFYLVFPFHMLVVRFWLTSRISFPSKSRLEMETDELQ